MTTFPRVHVDLLRHGETQGGNGYRGRTDDPLTDLGWKQMRDATTDRAWPAIWTSPLSRCADFARDLAQQHNVPLHVDARLREIDFGAWEGRDTASLMLTDSAALIRFWEDPLNYPPPDGESVPAMCARVLEAWNEIVSANRHALVVTHGGPIRAIVCHTSGIPYERMLQIDVAHASLHPVRIDADEAA